MASLRKTPNLTDNNLLLRHISKDLSSLEDASQSEEPYKERQKLLNRFDLV